MRKIVGFAMLAAAICLVAAAAMTASSLNWGSGENNGYEGADGGGTLYANGDIKTDADLVVDGDADLGTLVLDTPLAVAEGGTGSAAAADARTALGLAIGNDVQAYDAELAAIAGAGSAADTMIYYTAEATASTASITTAGRGLIDDAATSNMRATLDLEPGTDVQAYDAQLTDIAALAVTDGNVIVGDGANWVAESGATARTSLGLGSIATQAASAIAVTGGTMSGVTITTGTSGKACDAAAVLLANQLRTTLTDPRLILLWRKWTLTTVSTPDDYYYTIDFSGNSNHTYLATASWTQATHQVAQGNIWTADCGGARYGIIADADTLSFGNSSTDSAFSVAAWAYFNATGSTQVIARKGASAASAREWSFAFTSTSKSQAALSDASQNVTVSRAVDTGLSVGWHFVAYTYDGGGGATAANGITMYVDGVSVASTATNNANYVAMENLAQYVGVGADNAGGTLFANELAAILVDAAEWTAGEVLELYYMTAPLIEAL